MNLMCINSRLCHLIASILNRDIIQAKYHDFPNSFEYTKIKNAHMNTRTPNQRKNDKEKGEKWKTKFEIVYYFCKYLWRR